MDGTPSLIDPALALGHELPETFTSHDERDVALYALGVGAGSDPERRWDLPYVHEGDPGGFRVLPTFAVVPAVNALVELMKKGALAPGLRYGFDRTLHGEQTMTLLGPIPTRGRLAHRGRIKDLFDKGENALVVTEIQTFDEAGCEIARNEVTTFVRGGGGFGGTRGPKAPAVNPPERAPDAVAVERTAPNQALLYRLSGDTNPLHADPGFAAKFGFPRPILHGLCTLGFAGRHVLHAFCPGDALRIARISVRFTDAVFPGETLKTEMWRDGDEVAFRCSVLERNRVVLANATARLTAVLAATGRGARRDVAAA